MENHTQLTFAMNIYLCDANNSETELEISLTVSQTRIQQ